ncbi:MAG: ABC transporter ATP-binding protein [Treponema sp.]|nr:ABC transporter ATP-binding protein [Treponema sp.]
MDCIEFDDVSFSYPPVEGDLDENGKQVIPAPVFDHFTGTIPAGDGAFLTSLVGPNGSGKSTFMMLASGRLVPQSGRCRLFGHDVARLAEEEKNLLASVIYQNMEFESDESVDRLLSYVYSAGALKGQAKGIRASSSDLLAELIDVFELEKLLAHGLRQLSKGEIQRVLLAFAILYGSPSLFMDEPFFAMEESQKETALAYLKEYAVATGTAFFVSMHELDLSRKYADKVLLFYPDRTIDYGAPDEVMTQESLEKSYGVPVAMLKKQEDMTREGLKAASDAILRSQGNAGPGIKNGIKNNG